MIKNEEKIIERCLQNALSVCDAICVTDTGSTDSTCSKVEEIFTTLQIPTKLYHDGSFKTIPSGNFTSSTQVVNSNIADNSINISKLVEIVDNNFSYSNSGSYYTVYVNGSAVIP
jgi:glycosyltransferase involved in cell wall biosynthesis